VILFTASILPDPAWSSEKTRRSVYDDPFKEEILLGIDLLYDMKFDQAEALFSRVASQKPQSPVGYFYLAMVSWSRLASGFWSSDVVAEYARRIDKTIEVAKERIQNGNPDSYTYFYLGGALGFKGRFELMQHSWLSSFNLAYQAIQALEKCRKMDAGNQDVLFGLGVFDYYTARLSGVLKFLTYLLLHQGDREEGLRKLHVAAEQATYSATEAKSMLIHIYLFLEEDFRKSSPLIQELAARYRENPRHKFFEGVVCIREGKDAEYRAVAASLRRKAQTRSSGTEAALWSSQALYLEASYYLFRGRFPEARAKLDAILSDPDPLGNPTMIAWPLLKKGMSYDLEGKRAKAVEYYHRILAMENGAGAQFLAEKYLDEPVQENDPFLGY
jgi:tetratricopeptide (TPR) repeat protein